jgi:hypothetical protein
MKLKDKHSIKGSYVIKVYDSITNELIKEYPRVENLVVSGSGGYGRNLIVRKLAGDDTYPIEIDSAQIGTGATAPSNSDIALVTPVLTGIQVANVAMSNNLVIITFFMTNALLANGTYKEFGLFCNGRMFARSLITPNLVKGSNQNVVVDYTITLT